jgi:hypothetical protein
MAGMQAVAGKSDARQFGLLDARKLIGVEGR